MADDLPRPTPEGQLIRRVRDLAIPKLSIRAAAARIGMSAEQWGYVERGYFPGRSGNPPRPFSPPAATLAKMAHALRITPGRLEAEGQRPDAAEVLREIIRQDQDQAQAQLPEVADFARAYGIDPDDPRDPYIASVREEIAEAIKRYGAAPTGEQIFHGAPASYVEAAVWDDERMGARSKEMAIAAMRAERDKYYSRSEEQRRHTA